MHHLVALNARASSGNNKLKNKIPVNCFEDFDVAEMSSMMKYFDDLSNCISYRAISKPKCKLNLVDNFFFPNL